MMFSHLKSYFLDKYCRTISLGFGLLGFLFGTWAVMIPFVKEKFELNDATLGLVLLSMPLGAMIFNPFAALIIQKIGVKLATIFSMFFLSFAYLIPVSTDIFAFLPLGLILAGIGITSLNISVNTLATAYQNQFQLSIMSTSHGMFSVGLMLGSLLGSLALGYGILPHNYMYFICLIMILVSLISIQKINVIPIEVSNMDSNSDQKFNFFIPRGTLLIMIAISLCVNVTEGSMPDWTSIYMKETVLSSPYFYGWGLSGYSFFMAFGRFLGDGLIPKYGENNILKYGALCTFFGIGIAIVFPFTLSSIIGFSLVGLGVSCCSPILYSSASRVPDLPQGAGLALMNTFAMGGFLFGPVIIGFVSKLTNLSIAFSLLLVLSLIWFFLSKKVKLY